MYFIDELLISGNLCVELILELVVDLFEEVLDDVVPEGVLGEGDEQRPIVVEACLYTLPNWLCDSSRLMTLRLKVLLDILMA